VNINVKIMLQIGRGGGCYGNPQKCAVALRSGKSRCKSNFVPVGIVCSLTYDQT